MAATSSGTATVTLPTDRQILITREFDAPRHLVYKAWTTPELVKRWWHANRGRVTIAEIDLRTLYLKDLSLFGCTFQEDEVFENLVAYLESGEVRPVVSRSYPLAEIAQAQRDFLDAQNNELRALLNYRKALVNFETVQTVGTRGVAAVGAGGGGGL